MNQILEGARDRRRRGRPSTFTPSATGTIPAHIRAGASAHVAAEAAGVGYSTLRAWLASGDPAFREFREAYARVAALTRADAEQRVYRTRPLQWLRVMARSRPGRDGWTEPSSVGADDSSTASRGLTPERFEEVVQAAQRIAGDPSSGRRNASGSRPGDWSALSSGRGPSPDRPDPGDRPARPAEGPDPPVVEAAGAGQGPAVEHQAASTVSWRRPVCESGILQTPTVSALVGRVSQVVPGIIEPKSSATSASTTI
jgi:hypothetical protein